MDPKLFNLFTRLRHRGCLLGLAVTLAGLVTLIVLVYALENWRGRRQWEATKAAAEAQGISFDWSPHIPEPIPDERNLVMAPLLGVLLRDGEFDASALGPDAPSWEQVTEAADRVAALTSEEGGVTQIHWNEPPQDRSTRPPEDRGPTEAELAWLEEHLAPFRALLDAVRLEMELRPESYLPGDYMVPFSSPVPAFQAVRTYARLFTAEALLALAQGDTALVLADLNALQRLGAVQAQPYFLVTHMIRVVLTGLQQSIVEEGLRRGQFDATELSLLSHHAWQYDLVADLRKSLDRELAGAVLVFHLHRSAPENHFGSTGWERLLPPVLPEGWHWHNLSRLVDAYLLPREAFSANASAIELPVLDHAVETLAPRFEHPLPYDYYAALAIPSTESVTRTTIRVQARAGLIALAAAVRRYEGAHGNPPPTLDALFPTYLPAMPTAPVVGMAYVMETHDDGTVVLSYGYTRTNRSEADAPVILRLPPR